MLVISKRYDFRLSETIICVCVCVRTTNLCVLYIFMCICAHLCEHTHTAREQHWVIFFIAIHLSFETGFLTDSEITELAR